MPYPADIPGSQRVYLSDPSDGTPYRAGTGGSSTSAGTNGTSAQAVQGINGGVPVTIIPVGSTPLGYAQITDVSTSTALTPIPPGSTVATIIPDGAGVRMRKDGTAPTATVGMPVPVGGGVKLYGAEIAAARFIQQSAGAVLNIEYAK